MAQPLVLLDTGILWLAVHPRGGSETRAIISWMQRLAVAGYEFGVPEIADYEARRELIRRPAPRQIAKLNALEKNVSYLPITSLIMKRAAELWAQVRQNGKPTANDTALDGDVILGAQWETEQN